MAGVAAAHRSRAVRCLQQALSLAVAEALEPTTDVEAERDRLVDEAVDELLLAAQEAFRKRG